MQSLKAASIAALLVALAAYANQSTAAASKLQLNMGVLGAPAAGPRELGIALFAAARGKLPAKTDFIDAGELAFVDYEVSQAHVAQALFKNLPPGDFGRFFLTLQSLDGVIFAIERDAGPNLAILDQCLAAKAAGVPKLFIYVWSNDPPAASSDAAVLSLFSKCGYSPENIRVVAGRAQRQTSGVVSYFDVSALLNLVGNGLKPRAQNSSTAFALPIDDVFNISGRGTIVTGRVDSGEVKMGDELVAIGLGRKSRTSALDIEMFQRKLPLARSGDHVGITLDGIKRGDLVHGMILTKPNVARQASNFPVRIDFAQETENRGHAAGGRDDEYTLFTGATVQPVKVKFLTGQSAVIDSRKPVPIIGGWSFALRKKGKIAAIGVME